MMDIHETKRQRNRKSGTSHDYYVVYNVSLSLTTKNFCNLTTHMLLRFGIKARKSKFVEICSYLSSTVAEQEYKTQQKKNERKGYKRAAWWGQKIP